MKLARIVKWDACPWGLRNGGAINPPIGTIVQYERDVNNWCFVYFPGVRGCATMSGWMFNRYFKELDNETS